VQLIVLDRPTWEARRAAHEARVDAWIEPHLARRRLGRKHPVEDFLFRKVKITNNVALPARLRNLALSGRRVHRAGSGGE
jgi:hypothetical protein